VDHGVDVMIQQLHGAEADRCLVDERRILGDLHEHRQIMPEVLDAIAEDLHLVARHLGRAVEAGDDRRHLRIELGVHRVATAAIEQRLDRRKIFFRRLLLLSAVLLLLLSATDDRRSGRRTRRGRNVGRGRRGRRRRRGRRAVALTIALIAARRGGRAVRVVAALSLALSLSLSLPVVRDDRAAAGVTTLLLLSAARDLAAACGSWHSRRRRAEIRARRRIELIAIMVRRRFPAADRRDSKQQAQQTRARSHRTCS